MRRDQNHPYKELVRRMRERGVNAVPVVDSDHHLIGIVTETDLALKQEYRPGGPPPFLEGTQQRRQRRSLAREIVTRANAVDGVVGMVDRLDYRHDDTVPVWPSRPRR